MIKVQRNDTMEGYDSSRWIVALSNGECIYQHDGLDPECENSWTCLGKYCEENQLDIVGMRLQFRSNNIHLPPNQEGYYFAHGAFGGFGFSETWGTFYAGYLENGIVKVTEYKTPELIATPTGENLTRNPDTSGTKLIKNARATYGQKQVFI